jgi:hypothetical protein
MSNAASYLFVFREVVPSTVLIRIDLAHHFRASLNFMSTDSPLEKQDSLSSILSPDQKENDLEADLPLGSKRSSIGL